MTDHTKRRAIADAATQGEWIATGYIVTDEDGVTICVPDTVATARHIATFDPSTVLGLLDEIAEAQAIARALWPFSAGASEANRHTSTIAKWSKP